MIYTLCGLSFSYYYDVRPGGAIVVAAVIGIILFTIYGRLRRRPKTMVEASVPTKVEASAPTKINKTAAAGE